MKIAAIDIGTNSAKMTIAETAEGGGLVIIAEDSEVTRLGQAVDCGKRLHSEAIQRTLDAVKRFADTARSMGVDQIVAVGTSALRDASNGQDFLEQAKEYAGVDVEIITGDREAHYAYAAVHSDTVLFLPPDKTLVVFDIGGGSTEITSGIGSKISHHLSLNIGAVRLTERFFKTDPPAEDQFAAASECVDAALRDFPIPANPTVVGLGGTAVNLVSVTLHQRHEQTQPLHAQFLTAKEIAAALARLRLVPLDQRRQIPGLEPKRADVIVAGALILSRLLAYLEVTQCQVSVHGLRYGLLADAANP